VYLSSTSYIKRFSYLKKTRFHRIFILGIIAFYIYEFSNPAPLPLTGNLIIFPWSIRHSFACKATSSRLPTICAVHLLII